MIYEPLTIKEALSLLEKYKNKAKIIAGGTDVMVDLKHSDLSASYLISIEKIKELKFIKEDKNTISIGAGITISEVEHNRLIQKRIPSLIEVAREMASPQIRNAATVCGNIGRASPCADFPPVLIVLDSTIEIVSKRKKRIIKLEKFFKGPGKTVLSNNEIIKRIIIKKPSVFTGISYHKFGLRESNALAVVSVVAKLTLNKSKNTIKDAKIAIGSCSPTTLLAEKTSKFLEGKTPNDNIFKESSKIASKEIKPISDIRGSASYRRELTEVLTKRALQDSHKRINV